MPVGRQKIMADRIPAALLVGRYFAAGQQAIAELESKIAALQQEMEELVEEHTGAHDMAGVLGRPVTLNLRSHIPRRWAAIISGL